MSENLNSNFPDSGLPRFVGNEETLIRFFRDRSTFNATRVLPRAFQPAMSKKRFRFEVSVFRERGEEVDYWRNRNKEILPNQSQYGFAKIRASTIRNLKVEIEADDTPVAHANIIGWPLKEDHTLDKAMVNILTQEMAAKSEKVLYAA